MDYVVISPEILYQMADFFRSVIGSLFSVGIYVVVAFCILFLVVLLSLFCGYDWPPKPYDMPKTLLTTELVGSYLGGLFNSIRAIGNMGFIISMGM